MDNNIGSTSFKLSCIACQLIASLVLNLPANTNREDVIQSGMQLCVMYLRQPENLCRGVIEGNVDVLLDLSKQGIPITSDKICGTILENGNCANKPGPQVDWKVSIDSEKKPSKPSTPLQSGEISIIQITDIHYDPEYTMGKSSECSSPVCCRKDQPSARSIADKATKYGSYKYCDMPIDAIVSSLENIAHNHRNASLVYMTGDLVSHAIWETSWESNVKVFNVVSDLFKKYLGNIPCIPIIGNHETHPVNVFAPYFITGNTSTNYLYKSFLEAWGWSLPESAKKTFLKGGYYTMLIEEGFRIVAINSNIYQKLNWWNTVYPVDMNDQLAWLVATLLEAEKNNEKVHIISHIPPGSEDTMQVYQREYRKIVERFEHIITAEFNGHTHFEDFKLFFDKNDPHRAIRAAYNGGSITTYFDLNPNYRVYKVDKGSWEINDFDSFSYNISDILHDDYPPEWRKLYSFKEEYGVSSMQPEELKKLVVRMANDDDLFQKYFFNFFKGANKEKYDVQRKMKILCDTVISELMDQTQCDLLKMGQL